MTRANNQVTSPTVPSATAVTSANSVDPWPEEEATIKTSLVQVSQALTDSFGEPGLAIRIADDMKDYLYLDALAEIESSRLALNRLKSVYSENMDVAARQIWHNEWHQKRQKLVDFFRRYWRHPDIVMKALQTLDEVRINFGLMLEGNDCVLISCMEKYTGVSSIQVDLLRIFTRETQRTLRVNPGVRPRLVMAIVSVMKHHTSWMPSNGIHDVAVHVLHLCTLPGPSPALDFAEAGFFQHAWNIIERYNMEHKPREREYSAVSLTAIFRRLLETLPEDVGPDDRIRSLLVQQTPKNWEQIMAESRDGENDLYNENFRLLAEVIRPIMMDGQK